MTYQTAVFDLDGTLLNTLEDLADAVNYSLKKNKMPLCTRCVSMWEMEL